MDSLDQILDNLWTSAYVQSNPKQSYKNQYNAEYLAIGEYINGGDRPDPTSYSKMGKTLVGIEDQKRAASKPSPSPTGNLPYRPLAYQGGDPHNVANFPGFTAYHINNSNAGNPLPDKDLYLICDEVITRLGAVTAQVAPGRKVISIRGEIQMDQPATDGTSFSHSGLKFLGGAYVYVEGWKIGGSTLHDGMPVAGSDCDIVAQKIRIDKAHTIQGGHPDGIQTQGGIKSLKAAYCSFFSENQCVFLKDQTTGPYPTAVGPVELQYMNLVGNIPFWQETSDIKVTIGKQVWVYAAGRDLGHCVFPNKFDTYLSRQSQGIDGTTGLWPASSGITHVEPVHWGNASADFAGATEVGLNYTSTGYQS